jgi:hypothetical protein
VIRSVPYKQSNSYPSRPISVRVVIRASIYSMPALSADITGARTVIRRRYKYASPPHLSVVLFTSPSTHPTSQIEMATRPSQYTMHGQQASAILDGTLVIHDTRLVGSISMCLKSALTTTTTTTTTQYTARRTRQPHALHRILPSLTDARQCHRSFHLPPSIFESAYI